MSANSIAESAIEQGGGILRLAPTWVPRAFCVPGRRIKLHPDDYYALGGARGGIDERWFSSTTHADNGPGTPDDEGLSYVIFEDGGAIKKTTLQRGRRPPSSRPDRLQVVEPIPRLADVFQVFRQ